MSGKVEVAIKNAAEILGEGPHWEEKSNALLYVDIPSGVVSRWNAETLETKSIKLGGMVGFILPCQGSGYIVGHNKSLIHLDLDNASMATVVEVEKDLKTQFNDAKCDAAGRILAGTVSEFFPTFHPEMGTLYELGTDKSLKTLITKINMTNGLAWTRDNKTMYYIDSMPRKVYAFDYDLSSGDISNQRVAVAFGEGTEDRLGSPDGMTIDTEDKIWVTCMGAGKVIRFDPETGKQLQEIVLPVSKTTSCCFGGKNFDEMYVTSATYGLDEQQLAEQPLAGSVFKVTELGVKGYPANVYGGF